MRRSSKSEAALRGRSRHFRLRASDVTKACKSEDVSLIERLFIKAEHDAAIISAVESLYADKLKPYSRILRKRLSELSATSALAADNARLRGRCQECHMLLVQEEGGGEWSVVLVDRPPSFVDVYSTLDPYSTEFWSAADSYFRNIHDSEASLPGGRYACASALATRSLSFLSGFSLGHICHFVQLAISQRKLLGYRSGAVVPYALSLSKIKDTCALQQAPVVVICDTSVDAASPVEAIAGQCPLATWDQARACLKAILNAAFLKGDTFVPLSNLKRIFRTDCNLELSETSLGHSKLSELMQDVRMMDICQLKLQSFGYMLLPPVPHAAFQPPFHHQYFQVGTAIKEGFDVGYGANHSSFTEFCSDRYGEQIHPSNISRFPLAWDIAGSTPTVITAGSQCYDFHTGAISAAHQLLRFHAEPLQLDKDGSDLSELPTSVETGLSALSPRRLSSQGSLGRYVRNTFIHLKSPSSAQLAGSSQRSRSVPQNMGSRKSDWEASCNALSYLYCTAEHHNGFGTKTLDNSTECDTDQPSSVDSSRSDGDCSDGSDDAFCRRAFYSDESFWGEEEEYAVPTCRRRH